MLHYDAPQTEIVFRPGHRHAEFIKDIELQKQVRPLKYVLLLKCKAGACCIDYDVLPSSFVSSIRASGDCTASS